MRQIESLITPSYLSSIQNTYTTSDGTTRDISSLSSEAKAGLSAAKTTFGYDSDKDYFGG